MDLNRLDLIIGILISLVALFGAGWRIRAKVAPRWRRFKTKVVGIIDALAGRDAVLDSITGEVIKDAVPALGVRMAHQEEQMSLQGQQLALQGQQMELLTVTVTKLADQQAHQIKLEKDLDQLRQDLGGLEGRVHQLES